MMKEFFTRASRKTGLAPGTIVHVGEKPPEPVRVSVIDYDADRVDERENVSVEDCSRYRNTPSVTWINFDGVHEVNLVKALGSQFGLHPLLLEDIVNTHQRPKLEDFGDYLYIVLRMLSLHDDDGELVLENEQISIVMGSGVVLTFQERSGDVFDSVRKRIRDNRGPIRRSGADHLAYSIIDVVVDNYFAILERLGDEMEVLDDQLVDNPRLEALRKVQWLKRMMITIRRSVWPLRDVINNVLRGDVKLFKKPTLVFMRDVYDHTIRAVDMTETFREMLAGMHDLYLAQVSNRMNEVMKVLTVIATIFIPLTFIAGVYGMNFDNMPELHWRYGYWFVWLVMLSAGILLLVLFRRKHWL